MTLPTWAVYAFLSAGFAAATAILAKIGISGDPTSAWGGKPVPSNLATAIRTLVILVFAWGIVFAKGEQSALRSIDRRSLFFLMLSGLATGLSWLAYFRALSLGPASRVAPIDKLSLALTLGLAALVLGETITWRVGAGVALMIVGGLLTLG